MLYLPWNKKINLLFLLLVLPMTMVFGQGKLEGHNFRNFKSKPYYFGITLALNSSDYLVTNSTSFITNSEVKSINSIVGPGLTVGIIGNLKLGDYFDFRLLPSFSFASKIINYTKTTAPFESKNQYDQTLFEIPFMVRYKSHPYKDIRLFVGTGVKYSHDISNASQVRRASQIVRVSPSDFSFEACVGLQIFFPYFILSPEIKYSVGMNNSMIYNPNLIEATVIDKVQSRTFTISFHFEG